MHFANHADPPPLEEHTNGMIRVTGTRIPLERVIGAFLAGATPEQIAQDYHVLSIQNVYAVVNYYLHYRDEVDAYLAEEEKDAAAVQAEVQQRFDPVGIRARLLNRRP